MSGPHLLCLDCDSTLSAIEGVDELGRLRGPECLARVEAMTYAAMEGRLPVEEVFGRRLELIRPTRAEVEEIGRRYVAAVEPAAQSVLAQLRSAGWEPLILSGGFRPAIQPLAEFLGGLRIEAVDLFFNADGTYRDYDRDYPTTRSGGKPEVIARLRRERPAGRVVMVGDGVSDLETKPVVDLFVGFGRYAARPAVRSAADHFIHSLQDLVPLLPA